MAIACATSAQAQTQAVESPARVRAAVADYQRVCGALFEAAIRQGEAHRLPRSETEPFMRQGTFHESRKDVFYGRGEVPGSHPPYDAKKLTSDLAFYRRHLIEYPGAGNRVKVCSVEVALNHAEHGVPGFNAGARPLPDMAGREQARLAEEARREEARRRDEAARKAEARRKAEDERRAAERLRREAAQLVSDPGFLAELANPDRHTPELDSLIPKVRAIAEQVRAYCQPELIGESQYIYPKIGDRQKTLAFIDDTLARFARFEVRPRKWRIGYARDNLDPTKTFLTPFQRCGARWTLATLGEPVPAGAPPRVAAARPPVSKPKRPPPPRVGLIPKRRFGNGCVTISPEATRWSNPDDPASSIETIVLLRNGCNSEQLVEAKIDVPSSNFSRPGWTTRQGMAGARNIWRVTYPTDRLGFAPLEDKWQVFALGPQAVMETRVTQAAGSFRNVNTIVGSCDHYSGGRERTVFVDTEMTRFVCVNLPWPDESAAKPATYRPETVAAFRKQLSEACPAEMRNYLAANRRALVEITDFHDRLLRLEKLALIGVQSRIQQEVATPASLYKRCVILARFRQLDRGWLPSWDVP